MLRDPGRFVEDDGAMLADLAQVTPEPSALAALLRILGYEPHPFGSGLFAPGNVTLPTLLFPLHTRAGLTVRQRQLVGPQISRSATLIAGLAALRAIAARPPLLFMAEQAELPPGVTADRVVSLEGGVVPRVWRHCFGSMDVLTRVIGKRSHPGLTNTAINAIEAAVPVLQALLRLKADIERRTSHDRYSPDAPLRPRLTINAAHGGASDSALPILFDIMANRRYEPSEDAEAAVSEMQAAVVAAVPRSVRVEVAVTRHDVPVTDPEEAARTREDQALAVGWGWPQVRFPRQSALVPGATVFGGLDRPGHESDAEDAATSLDEMGALARSVRALLLAY